jgi:hypothetical protein
MTNDVTPSLGVTDTSIFNVVALSVLFEESQTTCV